MRWIRNPWWDGVWLLSGLPIGIVLLVLYEYGVIPPLRLMQGEPSFSASAPLAATIMILETGHRASPVALAWGNAGLRQIVKSEWLKYLILPIALVLACLFVPYYKMFCLYFAWNIWHFGMQLFGVTCLYRPQSSVDERVFRALGCLAFTIFGMAFYPFFFPDRSDEMRMLSFGVFSFNHWLTDIGLSSKASGWAYKFMLLVFGIGVIWLALRWGPLASHRASWIMPIILAIGFIHFIYSTIWKFSDPRVRAAIGPGLLHI